LKDFLAGQVSKFIAVKSSTATSSGWDTERNYMIVKHIFERKWPRLENADDICHCMDYLRDNPKWQAFTHANQSKDNSIHKRSVGQKRQSYVKR
jgi:hypothetical protein